MKPSTMTVTVDGQEYECEFTWSHPRKANHNPDSPRFGPAEGGLEEISKVKEKRGFIPHYGWDWSEIEPDPELLGRIEKQVREALSEEAR